MNFPSYQRTIKVGSEGGWLSCGQESLTELFWDPVWLLVTEEEIPLIFQQGVDPEWFFSDPTPNSDPTLKKVLAPTPDLDPTPDPDPVSEPATLVSVRGKSHFIHKIMAI